MKNRRIVSLLLSVVMILGMLPVIQWEIPEAKVEVEAAQTKTTDSVVKVFEAGKISGTTENGKYTKVSSNVTADFVLELWHYSGGYWAKGYDDKNRIYDRDIAAHIGSSDAAYEAFEKNGQLYGNKDFEYFIAKGSDLEKAIENGETLCIEIDKNKQNNNPDVSLQTLFDFPTEMKDGDFVFKTNQDGSLKGYDENKNETSEVAKVVWDKEKNQWKIVFSFPVKVHFYDTNDISFKKFKLNLRKTIALPKLGFGYIWFSMYPKPGYSGKNIPSRMWFAPEYSDEYVNIRSVADSGGSLYYNDYMHFMESYAGKEIFSKEYNEIPVSSDTVDDIEDLYKNYISTLSQEEQDRLNRIHDSMMITRPYIHPQMIDPKTNGHLKNGFDIWMGSSIWGYPELSDEWRIGKDTFKDAGAVGVLFDYSLTVNIYTENKPKVIATFMEITKVHEDGTVELKKALPSRLLNDEEYQVYEDGLGVKDIFTERIGDGDAIQEFECYYNDMIISGKDTENYSGVEWEGVKNPKVDNAEIKEDTLKGKDYYYRVVEHLDETGMTEEEKYERGFSLLNKSVSVYPVGNSVKVGSPLKNRKAVNNYPNVAKSILSTGVPIGGSATLSSLIFSPFISRNYSFSFETEETYQMETYNSANVAKEVVENAVMPLSNNEEELKVLQKELVEFTIESETDEHKSIKQVNNENSADAPIKISDNDIQANDWVQTSSVDLSNTIQPLANSSAEMSDEDSTAQLGNDSASEVYYVRYIIVPKIYQWNKLIIKEPDRDIVLTYEKESVMMTNEEIVTADVKLIDKTEEYEKDFGLPVELVKYTTKTKDPTMTPEKLKDMDLPGDVKGTTKPTEPFTMKKTEDIYAEWVIDLTDKTPEPVSNAVPQWRLSKFFEPNPLNYTYPSMVLSFSSDSGHKAGSSYIDPSEKYQYNEVNPNNIAVNNKSDSTRTPEYMKYTEWLHARTVSDGSLGSSYISHGSPLAYVRESVETNAIKDTTTSGHILADWLNSINNNALLGKYDIEHGYLSKGYIGEDSYIKEANPSVGVKNIKTYTHYRGIKDDDYYYCGGKHCSGHLDCDCYLSAETAIPMYTNQQIPVKVTFDRYKNAQSDKFVTSPAVNESNGMTTIKYQLKDTTLNIYPEYGMLFQEDNKNQSLKWVVGDQNRQISPVVYQTIQHKVYVSPVTTGTSVATDSRAITKATSLGLRNLQVIYKGAGANSAFSLYNDENKKSAALMTVKTYALDFEDDGSYSQVKSAWGNVNYDSYREHKSLLDAIDAQKKANATEKLLIDSPSYGSIDYTGGTIKQNTNDYKLKSYSSKTNSVAGGNAVVFEHKLIVRGGQVVAVKVQDRGTLQYGSPITLAQLKNDDFALYTALENMNLIGDKANTVFKNFEHQTGNKLTEAEYATLLNQARKDKDGFDSSALVGVTTETGWYSEDTTVLVVKEYVSNYTVPSISISDKISMSVKGLETPANKNQFFSQMGKGYLFLRYDLPIKSYSSSLGQDVNTHFEYTSFPNDSIGFGEQNATYLVPNASITDTTRLS